jgi:formate-dependent nitrite reductase membrane component NrfD
MKRTFLAKRNSLLSSRGISWGGVACIVGLVFLAVRLLVPNLFWRSVAPLYRAGDAVAAVSHRTLLYFDTVATRAEENETLRNENAALANKNEALTVKVEQLTALLGAAAVPEGGTHAGSIITRPP